MIIKGSTTTLRHVLRTHRIDLDWLFERFKEDPGLFIRYVSTKQQIADMLTKGSFTAAQWKELLSLSDIRKSLPSIKNTAPNKPVSPKENGGSSGNQSKSKTKKQGNGKAKSNAALSIGFLGSRENPVLFTNFLSPISSQRNCNWHSKSKQCWPLL